MFRHSPDGATVIVVLQHFCSSACRTFSVFTNQTTQCKCQCVSVVMVMTILAIKLAEPRAAVCVQEIRGRCEGRCEVTVESRSYCKRCRLQKCFTVGMKRELILSTYHRLGTHLNQPAASSINISFRFNNNIELSPRLAMRCWFVTQSPGSTQL